MPNPLALSASTEVVLFQGPYDGKRVNVQLKNGKMPTCLRVWARTDAWQVYYFTQGNEYTWYENWTTDWVFIQ